jgi:ribosomal-protein-serine acetyltransferase
MPRFRPSAALQLIVESDERGRPRTELRLLSRKDAGALFSLIDANRAFLGAWLPWVATHQEEADSEALIDKTLRQFEADEALHFGVWHLGALAGCLAIEKLDRKNRKCQIGYWLAEAQCGKGIMTRSCLVLIRYAFREMKLHRLTIRCAVENQRSRRLAERLGFRHEGIIRETEWLSGRFVDHALYGLLESEAPAC